MDKIVAALRAYFEARPELGIASVYLFGSHAEGRAHQESDIDVALLLKWDRYPTRRDRFEARVVLGSELIAALHHNEVDVVILNDAPPPFGRKVIYDGIRAYVGDPAADFAYVRDVQNRAADMEPWLRWTRKLKLETLTR